MAQVIKEIQLEVSKPNFFQAIIAKQFDTGSRWLRATLVDNGEKITVADSSTVTINARRSDGGENKFIGSVDKGQGTVLVPLTYWMLELEGTVKSDISVTDSSGNILTTTSFTIEVERASCQSGSVSPDEADVTVLQGLINEVSALKDEVLPEQNYDADSTKAMSGKAVAQALTQVEIDVDPYMSDTSTNPVQNKTLKQYIDSEISDAVTSGAISQSGDIRLKPNFANDISECIDTSKLYVLPDGFIYAYIYSESDPPEIQYEHKSNGYWQYYSIENQMVSKDNKEGAYSNRTNILPVQAGDIFNYILGNNDEYVPAVVWYDDELTILSVATGRGEFTVPSGVSYAQFYSYEYNLNDAILEVEWVKCQAIVTGYQWKNTYHAFVPADYESVITELSDRVQKLESETTESVLKDKILVYDGDSICYGAGYKGGYAKLIADKVGCHYVNQGIGGARLITRTDDGHSVVDNLTNLPKTDGDLYCFEGGINDYWTDSTLGTYDKADFEGELDTSTVCGALETIFRYALNNFVGKPICFVITHKIQNTAYKENSNGDTFEDYRNAMVGICNKYSIPYYDAFNESGLNGWNTAQNNNFFQWDEGEQKFDGCHPNEEGYKRYYVPQLISLFEKIMPRE